MGAASEVANDSTHAQELRAISSSKDKQASSKSTAPHGSGAGNSVGPPPTPALVSQLEARLVATENECAEIDNNLVTVREKIETALRCLRKRPSVNGDEVDTGVFGSGIEDRGICVMCCEEHEDIFGGWLRSRPGASALRK